MIIGIVVTVVNIHTGVFLIPQSCSSRGSFCCIIRKLKCFLFHRSPPFLFIGSCVLLMRATFSRLGFLCLSISEATLVQQLLLDLKVLSFHLLWRRYNTLRVGRLVRCSLF
jgi:hypothetical protein